MTVPNLVLGGTIFTEGDIIHILQAIKNWTVGSPGNKAIGYNLSPIAWIKLFIHYR